MTKKDMDNLPGKHQGVPVNRAVAEHINAYVTSDKLTCKTAMKIAKTFDVDPLEVGSNCDLLKIKLTGCQLGLFGLQDQTPEPDLEAVLKIKPLLEQNGAGGILSCKQCWELSDLVSVSYRDAGQACDELDIKIVKCQLGAFQ